MTSETPRLPESHLRRVWERLAAIYGAKWTSVMGASPNRDDGTLSVFGDTWEHGLRALTDEQIACGIRTCATTRSDPWPPSLPEFRLLCLNIPSLASVRAAFREIGTATELAPFALMVYRHLDLYLYRRADIRAGAAMLREAYDEASSALLRGEPLPVLAGVVEHKPEPPKPATRETVDKCLREMRESLGSLS